ncbi:MAG: hypothetical protein GX859_05015 [Corynebacterium humireducens]|jgi:hypothetical protein|uniref:PD-(D/E)XK endonuclease-like domain-containing protein n=1 Tax=Corynebacterium humireducens TaxID=1223514 RepID=A0A7X6PMC1_9CORY|nr:hypothetical protein [Corynebacterium humireducens]
MDYSGALLAALLDARRDDPARPVTVLCGPQARGDVIVALAQHGPQVGVTVQTLPMYLRERARELAPRLPLSRQRVMAAVTTILHDEDTEFRRRGLADQPMTRRGVVRAVLQLLELPREWRPAPEDAPLPRAVHDMAQRVERMLAADFFTPAEVHERVLSTPDPDQITLILGVVAASPTEKRLIDALPGTVIEVAQPDPGEQRTTSYVDEDEEVHGIARAILGAQLGDGGPVIPQDTPLHRIAVAACDPSYIGRLSRVFTAAGIPFTAPSTTFWADDPAVRAVRELLALDPERLPRRSLARALITGSLREAPSLEWFDRVTRRRDVSINEGPDWKLLTDDGVSGWVTRIRGLVGVVWAAGSWQETAAALQQLVTEAVRPTDESRAFLRAMITDLAELDGAMPAPTRGLVLELIDDVTAQPRSSTTHGQVVIGALDSLAGRDLDAAFICGAGDSVLPGTWPADPCIATSQSRADSSDFLRRQEELLSAAVASASHVFFSYPRSTLAEDGSGEPSPWIPEASYHSPGLHASLSSPVDVPVTDAEEQTVAALHGRGSAQARGVADRHRWRSAGASGDEDGAEYNGYVSADLGAGFFRDRHVSASALESFTRSPLLFFLSYLADGHVLEDPDATTDIDPRQRGLLYHRVFEEWTRQVWLTPEPRPTGGGDIDWAQARLTLQDITTEILDAQTSARFGDAAWHAFCADVRRTVDRWFEGERQDALDGWMPVGAELDFGGDDATPLTIECNGEPVAFRGTIDRVDVRRSPGRVEVRVTDYKSGRARNYAHVSTETPTGTAKDGYRFQLALYGTALTAAAAGQPGLLPELSGLWDGSPATVSSRFLFFHDAGTDHTCSIDMTPLVQETFTAQVSRIHDHICHGRFPAHSVEVTPRWGPDPDILRFGPSLYLRQAEVHKPVSIDPSDEKESVR